MSTPSDPNGWVSNPPSTLVKVSGLTSRPSLNGAFGLVLGYTASRSRYTVHMAVTQDQVALKAENLQKCSWLEQVQAQYQLLRYDASLQRQIQSVMTSIQQKTGVQKPQYLAAAALAFLLGLVYLMGFTRVLMTISFAMLVGMIIGEDVWAGASLATIRQNAPTRGRQLIRQSIPVVGPRIADSPYLSAALGALVCALFVRSVVWPVGSTNSNSVAATTTTAVMPPLEDSSSWSSLKERYYKLGFEDATELKPYGTSLATMSRVSEDAASVNLEDDDWPSMKPTGGSSGSKSPWAYMSVAMSAYYVVNTVVQLGGHPFDINQVRHNLATMEPWRMGMVGIAVYRIVSTLFL